MRIYTIIMISVVAFFATTGIASANVDWHISGGAFQGMTTDGLAYSRIDTTLENPGGDMLWGIAPTDAWFEITYINDDIEVFDQARIAYQLGESNNFKAAAIYLDYPYEESGIGFMYNPEHFNVDWKGIDLSAFVMEGGGYLTALDTRYEFTPGYGAEAHMLWRLDQDMTHEYLDGRVSLWHNLERDGSLYAELGYEDRASDGWVYFGIGGVF